MKKIFQNLYGELRSGWAIAIALIVMIAAQLIARPISELGDENDPVFKLMVTFVYGLIAIGGILLSFKLLYKRSFRLLGFIPDKGGSAFICGLVSGTFSIWAVFFLLIAMGQAKIIQVNMGKLFSLSVVAEFISVCFFMFSEELLARGFFMTAMKTTRNKPVILFVPAVIFALLHFMNPDMTVLSLLNTFLAGVLFGCMFIKSGALWLSTGFHVAWNFFVGDIFGMKTSGTEQASVLTTAMGENALLTGLPNGPDASIFTTGVLLLAIAIVHIMIKKPKHSIWMLDSDLPLTRGK